MDISLYVTIHLKTLLVYYIISNKKKNIKMKTRFD